MTATLLVSIAAFTLLYVYFLAIRLNIAKLKLELTQVKEELRAEL